MTTTAVNEPLNFFTLLFTRIAADWSLGFVVSLCPLLVLPDLRFLACQWLHKSLRLKLLLLFSNKRWCYKDVSVMIHERLWSLNAMRAKTCQMLIGVSNFMTLFWTCSKSSSDLFRENENALIRLFSLLHVYLSGGINSSIGVIKHVLYVMDTFHSDYSYFEWKAENRQEPNSLAWPCPTHLWCKQISRHTCGLLLHFFADEGSILFSENPIQKTFNFTNFCRHDKTFLLSSLTFMVCVKC